MRRLQEALTGVEPLCERVVRSLVHEFRTNEASELPHARPRLTPGHPAHLAG